MIRSMTERSAQGHLRGALWRPRILAITEFGSTSIAGKDFSQRNKIQVMSCGSKRRQILFREAKQTNCGTEPSPMLRVRRMFVMLLQMDEGTRGLDKAFEILRVFRRDRIVKPHLFQDIVCFVIMLFVPTPEESAVIRMRGDFSRAFLVSAQRFDESRNPLAFAHEGLNLTAPAMMGKRRRFSLREERSLRLRRRSRS
jgi:hypothetical protein